MVNFAQFRVQRAAGILPAVQPNAHEPLPGSTRVPRVVSDVPSETVWRRLQPPHPNKPQPPRA
jgi:hypothetical protein